MSTDLTTSYKKRANYKPLHKPLVVLKPGESKARSAKTYRGYRRNRDLKVHGAHWIVRNVYLDI